MHSLIVTYTTGSPYALLVRISLVTVPKTSDPDYCTWQTKSNTYSPVAQKSIFSCDCTMPTPAEKRGMHGY